MIKLAEKMQPKPPEERSGPYQPESREAALAEYIKIYETMSARSVPLLAKTLAHDARFKDPFSDVRGPDKIMSIFQKMFRQLNNPKFHVVDQAWGTGESGNIAYLRWTLTFTDKSGRREIPGVSEVAFGPDHLIIEHLDYWDSGEHLYARLPLLGWIINKIRKKLSPKD